MQWRLSLGYARIYKNSEKTGNLQKGVDNNAIKMFFGIN